LSGSSIYGPVTDWATDFDHTDPEYNRDPAPIWKELRDKCPVAHSERYGGMWVPVTHAHVREIAYDTEHFTSRSVVVSTIPPTGVAPVGSAPPITSDPPFHREARRLLLPAFAPRPIEAMEGGMRAMCRGLIDAMGPITPGQTVVDAAQQYAQDIPVKVIAQMLGFPAQDAAVLRGFVHDLLESVNTGTAEQMPGRDRFDAYLNAQIADHRANPRDDLTSYLLQSKIGDQPLSDRHVQGTIMLLLLAGIDTTWSSIGSALLHLATHPDDLARLVREPGLMPTAIEELLRAYSPATMARLVKEDFDFHGCPMKANDWVLLPFPAANRDPEAIEDADQVIIDRQVNRHAAFGLGMHRCIGSNLARLETQVAVEEFIRRFPSFEIPAEGGVQWSVGQIRGPRKLPVRVLQVAADQS
jgi:cytochrome P450